MRAFLRDCAWRALPQAYGDGDNHLRSLLDLILELMIYRANYLLPYCPLLRFPLFRSVQHQRQQER